MPKLKPLAVYVALIIGILILVLVWSKSPPAPEPAPKPTPLPPPSGIINQNQNLNVALPSFTNVPTTAPQFTSSPINQADYINLLSNIMGDSVPQPTTYPNNQTRYKWKNNQTDLYYYPSENKINYLNTSVLNAAKPLPNSLIDEATNYINKFTNSNSLVSLTLVSTTYLSSNETVAKEVLSPSQANLIQYEFRYLLAGFPLYLEPYAQPDIIITLNQDGARNIKAKLPPTILKTPDTITLLGRNEISQLLSLNQFTIIKVSNNQYYEVGPLFDIKRLSTKSTSLGYIVEGDGIAPYYIISGTAPNTQNQKITYQVEVAVRATAP